MDAVFLEDLEEVRELLAQGADPDTARDEDGRTPILTAVYEGNGALVKLLLDAGADPDTRDADGWTALHVAAQRRRLDLVWLLVRAGADVNAQDADGNSVLWRAVLAGIGGLEILELLRRAGARDDIPNRQGFSARDVAAHRGVALPPRAPLEPS